MGHEHDRQLPEVRLLEVDSIPNRKLRRKVNANCEGLVQLWEQGCCEHQPTLEIRSTWTHGDGRRARLIVTVTMEEIGSKGDH